MSFPTWIRWAGLASMLAGLAWIVGSAGMLEVLPLLTQVGGHWVLGLAGLLTLLAIVGIFARDAQRTAWWGIVGYALALIGATVFAIGNVTEVGFGLEFGTVLFGLGLMSLIVGVVLLSVATLRTKVLPSWSVWPLIIGLLVFLLVVNFAAAMVGPTAGSTEKPVRWIVLAFMSAMLLGAGWMTVGYVLWSDKEGKGTHPEVEP